MSGREDLAGQHLVHQTPQLFLRLRIRLRVVETLKLNQKLCVAVFDRSHRLLFAMGGRQPPRFFQPAVGFQPQGRHSVQMPSISGEQKLVDLIADLPQSDRQLLGCSDTGHVQRHDVRRVVLQTLHVPRCHQPHQQQQHADSHQRRGHPHE
jgi:hypothetical protein